MKTALMIALAGTGFAALFASTTGPEGGQPPLPPGHLSLDEKKVELSKAIGHAEGYGREGAIPTRARNPGDLAVGDLGLGVLGPSRVTVFATDTEGWAELYHIVRKWLAGDSAIYFLSDTIAEVARKYVNGPRAAANRDSENWARNVASELGISTDTTLAAWLAS